MVRNAMALQSGDSVLDIGCGTGWFTRHAEALADRVVGLDIDPASLDFARRHATSTAGFVLGDATDLPFADVAFDKVMSITALCFVPDWPRAIAEIVRVTRDRFAIGLLNRTGLLYLYKGRRGGSGAYAGAHWHTRAELSAAMRGLPVERWTVSYGVFALSGGGMGRLLERVAPASLPIGSFLLLAGWRASG